MMENGRSKSMAWLFQVVLMGLMSTRSAAWMSMSSTTSNSGGMAVTVVGGTGFVGSRVCQMLTAKGAKVTSVSRSGKIPDWCANEPWTKEVTWTAVDLLSSDGTSLDLGKGNDAIVSCVGVVGTDRDELLKGNGNANVAAFGGDTDVKRSVFVSVSSEVSGLDGTFWVPEFMSGYFEGKRMGEAAALEAVGGEASNKACIIIRPSFIYGGDSFGLFPPRVNGAYGSAVEELLSLGPFCILADLTPGLIKVALRPPSSVDAVAAACAAAALGEIDGGILDGTKAINAATNQPDPTGLTEAIDWTKENLSKAYDWAQVEVPKAIEWTKEKIEDTKKK
eukprot:scaffold96297_cov53-Attheya_sp.AAC.5